MCYQNVTVIPCIRNVCDRDPIRTKVGVNV